MIKSIKKSVLFVLILSFVVSLFMVLPTRKTKAVNAEDNVSISIDMCNLAFQDNVYILYAVKVTGTNNKPEMLIWKNDEGAVYNDNSYDVKDAVILQEHGKEEINGEIYSMFVYDKLSAKQMTENVYCKARVDTGNGYLYTDIFKYSILQYATNMLSKETTPQELKDLLNAMLEYGACAQKYKEHNLGRLANFDYFTVKLENGTFLDGTKMGVYLKDEEVEIVSNLDDFIGWQNKTNELCSFSKKTTLKVSSNIVMSAVNELPETAGLEYDLLDDGTGYQVRATISCLDTTVSIPKTHEGLPVTKIAVNGFSHDNYLKFVKKLIIPSSVKIIDEGAFAGCNQLETIIFGSGVETIAMQAFDGCIGLKTVIIPDSVKVIDEKAFANCEYITTLVIGNGVESINKNAFQNCFGIQEIFYNKADGWEGVTVNKDSGIKNKDVYYYSDIKPIEGLYWHYENDLPTKWVIE